MTIARKLTRKHTYLVNYSDGWRAYFHSGYQTFCLAEKTTKRRAQWLANMFGIALANVVKEQAKPK